VTSIEQLSAATSVASRSHYCIASSSTKRWTSGTQSRSASESETTSFFQDIDYSMARLRASEAAERSDINIHNDSSSERANRSSTAATPPFSPSSDKENPHDKPPAPMSTSSRRPAPDDDDERGNSRDKRPRLGNGSARAAQNPDTQYFDPNQDVHERRRLRKDLREIHKEAADNRQEWLKTDNDGLIEAVHRSNSLFQNVKQTSDATIDSRFLTIAGELTLKKTQKIAMEEGAQGLDVDQFVGKCISFMNAGGDGSQRRRGADADDSEDEGDIGDALNWEWLGAQACFPHNTRPPTSGFLLGPLSIQKRVRTVRARTQRLSRQTNVETTRPDELKVDDLKSAENGTLVYLCKKIRERLNHVAVEGRALAEARVTDDMTEAEEAAVMDECNIASDSGVPLFKFALHPTSFGQSIENLFYVSFLIRDGLVGIQHDVDGMPTLRKSLYQFTIMPDGSC